MRIFRETRVITGQRPSVDLRLLAIAVDRWAPPCHLSRRAATGFGKLGRRNRSCQTYRMTEGPEGDVIAAISAELTSCRKRGIERPDLRTHNQAPVPTPQLQRLANEYLMAKGRQVRSRIAQIKHLLHDAVSAFADEDQADAKLVRALFFGDSQHKVTKSAGELLDTARRQSGFGSNEARFRQARHDAFDNFAEFIPRFVADADQGNETEAVAEATAEAASYGNESLGVVSQGLAIDFVLLPRDG